MAEDKKIIIDEDWKSQVQAEKAEAARKASSSSEGSQAPGDRGDMPMPPASFEMLVTTLATEAMVALGQIQHPATNQLQVQRNQAKYLIDTIDILKQKTDGNLSPAELQLIDTVLHQLKLLFVETGTSTTDSTSPPVDHLA